MSKLEDATINLQRTVEEILSEISDRDYCKSGSGHRKLYHHEFEELSFALDQVHRAAKEIAFGSNS